jgi:SAM-dependent methyltransferase
MLGTNHTQSDASLGNEGRTSSNDGTVAMVPNGSATPDRILDASYAFWRSKLLFSAVELDLFTLLAEAPLDLETLASRSGLHGRGARDFLDALVALGFLWRDETGRYCNEPDSDRFLDRNKCSYIGALLLHLNARHYRNWGLLTQALRTGMPQSGALATGNYPALYADTATRELFLHGMSAGSLLAARALAVKFPWQRYRTVIDVGTAEGCVPVEIARMHPHLTGGGFDLPAIEPAFAAHVHNSGLSDRLRFYPGDFLNDPLPHGDVLVMGRILHNWDLPNRKLLLNKAHQALSPGGALIVYDPLIDDERMTAHGLLSSLNMLLETAGGSEYTARECKGWMEEAGLADVSTEPLGDMHSAVIGIKPI